MKKDETSLPHRQAVALRYEPRRDTAPRVTASGRGRIADRILDTARRFGVPIREDPDLLPLLARLDLHEEIPPALYRAVAEVLAFVYAANEKMARGADWKDVDAGGPSLPSRDAPGRNP